MPFSFHHRKNKWPVSDGSTKQCRSCKAFLPVGEFWVNRLNADGLQHRCKTCSRTHSYSYRITTGGKASFAASRQKSRLAKYSITSAEFDAMLITQDGRCAICRKAERIVRRTGKPLRLAVDHDHKTGKIRGLLCAHCNQAIGKLDDDPKLIRAAADYIDRHRAMK